MAIKVPKCPDCYADLDFNGKCPICNLRKNHSRKKMMRKNTKANKAYDKYKKYNQKLEEDYDEEYDEEY